MSGLREGALTLRLSPEVGAVQSTEWDEGAPFLIHRLLLVTPTRTRCPFHLVIELADFNCRKAFPAKDDLSWLFPDMRLLGAELAPRCTGMPSHVQLSPESACRFLISIYCTAASIRQETCWQPGEKRS